MLIKKSFIFILAFSILHLIYSISKNKIKADCSSSKMCPPGWSVQRQKMSKDNAAVTCEVGLKKCDKPYTCVASHCGLKFCCANDKILKNFQKESEEIDSEDYDYESGEIDDNKNNKYIYNNYEL
uniref:WAP domain-containing protein n=1 Tax=Strongyloides stercoralis TaxID=6248 RepID=A0A0K0E211_STRER